MDLDDNRVKFTKKKTRESLKFFQRDIRIIPSSCPLPPPSSPPPSPPPPPSTFPPPFSTPIPLPPTSSIPIPPPLTSSNPIPPPPPPIVIGVQKKSITFAEDIILLPPLSTPTPFMASFQPIGGINCGPSHRPQLAQPLPTKKKMSLPKGISSNCVH
ncbi:hypothetical protein CY35_15G033800 [Sphagnum magellanicum]|nr:hypothetical protein CY35_15G033800 [Sphagnum magellanicum]